MHLLSLPANFLHLSTKIMPPFKVWQYYSDKGYEEIRELEKMEEG
jgi:hypothetical protein